MGTISKALSKYRRQRKPGDELEHADGPAKRDHQPLHEAVRSVFDRKEAHAGLAEEARLQPDRVQAPAENNRERALPVEPGPKTRAETFPAPESPAWLKPLRVPPEVALPKNPAVEERKCIVPPPLEKFDAKLVVVTKPFSFEAEQFKLLRSSLLFPSSGTAPRSILVTSTDPGEGKTLVSANLAASVALNLDRYVLLIDCDVRRPFLHKLFGFDEHPGLSEYLTGCCSLDSLLLKTSLERFSFLSAGKISVNPAELLNSDKMFGLMNEVRDRYSDRLVIIDSPPPMLASESKALAQVVDGVLLVIKYRSTAREDAAEVVEKIGKDKILGTVLNFMDKQALGYYRANKYSYKYYGQA